MHKLRNIFVLALAALLLPLPPAVARAAQGGISPERQLKLRHKEERKAFKLKKKQMKLNMRSPQFTKAVRIEMMHQVQKEERELRERQKNEFQDWKDQQRVMKEYQKGQ